MSWEREGGGLIWLRGGRGPAKKEERGREGEGEHESQGDRLGFADSSIMRSTH